jgi:hypothetical protein
MRFDYRMRPGVLTRTNGVNVMAALGLLPLPKAATTDAKARTPLLHSVGTVEQPGSSANRLHTANE